MFCNCNIKNSTMMNNIATSHSFTKMLTLLYVYLQRPTKMIKNSCCLIRQNTETLREEENRSKNAYFAMK